MAVTNPSISDTIKDLWALLKAYGKQETVDPLKALGRYLCFGISGAILLSLGVVKTYDIVLAMTNGGPGTSTWTPAYFTINAYTTRSNIGYASAAAVIMLMITAAFFLPLLLATAWQARRREAAVR